MTTEIATIVRGIRSDLGIGRGQFGELLRELTGSRVGLSEISRWETGAQVPNGATLLAILKLNTRLAAAIREAMGPPAEAGLSATEAAALLGVTRAWFYLQIKPSPGKQRPAWKIRRLSGSKVLYSRADVEKVRDQRQAY